MFKHKYEHETVLKFSSRVVPDKPFVYTRVHSMPGRNKQCVYTTKPARNYSCARSFYPEVFFNSSRLLGACPLTTDHLIGYLVDENSDSTSDHQEEIYRIYSTPEGGKTCTYLSSYAHDPRRKEKPGAYNGSSAGGGGGNRSCTTYIRCYTLLPL